MLDKIIIVTKVKVHVTVKLPYVLAELTGAGKEMS